MSHVGRAGSSRAIGRSLVRLLDAHLIAELQTVRAERIGRDDLGARRDVRCVNRRDIVCVRLAEQLGNGFERIKASFLHLRSHGTVDEQVLPPLKCAP